MRRLLPLLLVAIVGGIAWWFWTRGGLAPSPRPSVSSKQSPGSPAAPAVRPERGASTTTGRAAGSSATAERSQADMAADFPIAAPLNEPGGTIARDLDIMRQLFEAWLSNFPHEGNPIGENAEITAALMGENRLGLALVPKGHRAVSAQGELCDRWGTPFRFHQLSGTKMEIRSAGPDRRFATDDDAVWTPQ